MVINTEYLAISVIFLGGMYFGFKLKQGMYNLNNYVNMRRNPQFIGILSFILVELIFKNYIKFI